MEKSKHRSTHHQGNANSLALQTPASTKVLVSVMTFASPRITLSRLFYGKIVGVQIMLPAATTLHAQHIALGFHLRLVGIPTEIFMAIWR